MVLVLVNVPRGNVAEVMSRTLVKEELAACVTVHPATSTYRWEGKVQCDDEETLTIKTTLSVLEEVRARVYALHPYETPEFLVVAVDATHSGRSYLDWVHKSVKPRAKNQ